MKQLLDLTVMMYHYVRDRGDTAEAGSGIPGMSVKTFESQLNDLSNQHTFVTWPDVKLAVQGHRPLASSACLLTFDDGVIDHYINVFHILQRRKVSGLFFAMSRCENEGLTLPHKIHFLLAKMGLAGLRDAIWEKLDAGQRERFTEAEKKYLLKYPPLSLDKRINLLKAILQRELSTEVDPILGKSFEESIGSEKETARNYYLNTEQIREMAEGGMHFGGHTHSHPWFDWIDSQAREAEIKASASWLERVESGPWAFAYPYGGLSEDSPGLLQAHGFIAAFTTRTQLRHSDPYFIGRLDGEEVAQDGQGYG